MTPTIKARLDAGEAIFDSRHKATLFRDEHDNYKMMLDTRIIKADDKFKNVWDVWKDMGYEER
jgi:hypothetical protein